MKATQIVKLIVAIFAVIIVGTAAVFMIKNRIDASAKNIYRSRSMLRVLENRDSNYTLLKADYPFVQEGLSILRDILPTEDNLGAVITSLDSLANETNVVQNLVFDSLASAQVVGGMRSVNFSVNLDGNFGSFENYFKKLEELPYFIEIESININNNAGVFNNDSRLTFRAKLYIKN